MKFILHLFFFFSCLTAQAESFDFIMVRHARAPGTGDPKNFQLGDCTTQRNLSPEGISQAQQLGKLLPKGIKIYSSQWCRCLDTAKNLNLGDVNELPLLNSFFQDRQNEKSQTDQLKAWLQSEVKKKAPFLLVTHQVNISALVEIFPSEGELIYAKLNKNGNVEIVKRK